MDLVFPLLVLIIGFLALVFDRKVANLAAGNQDDDGEKRPTDWSAPGKPDSR